jgi:aminoglycoside 2'-N-acetyltransferase I
MGRGRHIDQTGGVEVRSFPQASVPRRFRSQLLAAHAEAWPAADELTPPAEWPTHDPALQPVAMMLVADDTVLAALDILSKPIQHTGDTYLAGGLSTVVTPLARRGLGYGHRLVSAAREAMAAGDWDLGLFTCDRPLQAFYECAGWHLLPGAVLVGGSAAAPFASDQPGFDKVTMVEFFSGRARRHRSTFAGARIALYPGEIDRLW